MRLCRFNYGSLGLVVGRAVHDVTQILGRLSPRRYPFPNFDLLVAHLNELRPDIEKLAATMPPIDMDDITFQCPVANPGKIIAAPVNYKKHLEEARCDVGIHHQNQIAEIQRVGMFLKATSALIGASEDVVIRMPERRNDHEIELVVVIGETAKDIPVERALDVVAGYAIGLDVTVRGPEERSLRKSLDTFAVVGPWLTTADEIADPGELELELTVNSELRQKANTRDLVIDVPHLIAWASSFYTLHPGDILFTGTPAGVGPIVAGDVIVASIDRIGRMQVHVR